MERLEQRNLDGRDLEWEDLRQEGGKLSGVGSPQ